MLVTATHLELGDVHERALGYPQKTLLRDENNGGGDVFQTNTYLFEEMKKNCKHWRQYIPMTTHSVHCTKLKRFEMGWVYQKSVTFLPTMVEGDCIPLC